MKTPKAFISVTVLLVVFVAGGHSALSGTDSGVESRFREANELYAAGDYCEAAELYRTLAGTGVRDGRLCYNCGNAYLKCGLEGRALQYYEKAQRLLPRDPDIRHNLEFVRNRIDAETRRPGFIGSVLSRIVFFLSIEELLVTESLAVLILAAAGTIRLHSRKRRSFGRKSSGTLIVLAGPVVLLSLAFLAVQIVEQSDTEAIVVVDRIDARSGPGENHGRVLSIPEGTKVWVGEEREGWYLIHLATGRGGWLPVDTVGVI